MGPPYDTLRGSLRVAPLMIAAALGLGCSSGSSSPSGPTTGDGGGADVDASRSGGGDGSTGSPGDGGTGAPDDASTGDAPTLSDGAGTPSPDAGASDAGPGAGGDGGGPPGKMQVVEMTFYGWDDNSPPGNAIAYPMNGGYPTVHDAAGGTGTYADPITFATDMSELPPGTLVYAPVIEKYLVMEDDCGQCDTDWGSQTWHIDVWMNSDGTENANSLFQCEDQWTQSATTIEIGPPPGRTVTTAPLFVPATNTCRTTP